MKAIRRALALVTAGALTFLLAAPAMAAAPPTTYHGVFDGPVAFRGCTPAAPVDTADGQWNVIIRGDMATVAFNIFVNGRHHVSFGGVAPIVAARPGETFAVSILTGAGPLRVSLAGTRFMYDITPYDFSPWGGLKCDGGVTYYGTLQ